MSSSAFSARRGSRAAGSVIRQKHKPTNGTSWSTKIPSILDPVRNGRKSRDDVSSNVLRTAAFLLVVCTGLLAIIRFWTAAPSTSNIMPAKRISPFTSHPPLAKQLVLTRAGAGDTRNDCLSAIRQVQQNALQPYFAQAQHVLLVDPAYHSNVGDHMITVGEMEFLKQALVSSGSTGESEGLPLIAQCSYTQAGDYVPKCRDVLEQDIQSFSDAQQAAVVGQSAAGRPPSKVAVWHGGGNFGDLWPLAQEARIESLLPLLQAGYTIVAMPNSWYYANVQTEARDVQRMRDAIVTGLFGSTTHSESNTNNIPPSLDELEQHARHRIVWTWREHVSYKQGLTNFPYCTNLLVPDIAFQLGPYDKILPTTVQQSSSSTSSAVEKSKSATATLTTDILFLLRDDHESLYASQRNRPALRTLIQQALRGSTTAAAANEREITFSIVDWNDRLARFDSNDIFFTDTAIQLLSLGRVLICDRLHAAILAYLTTELPFIYVDQLTGKISKTLEVAMESSPTSCQQPSRGATGADGAIQPQLWSSASNLTDAIQQAVQILNQNAFAMPKNNMALTREQRRDRLRQKLAQGAP